MIMRVSPFDGKEKLEFTSFSVVRGEEPGSATPGPKEMRKLLRKMCLSSVYPPLATTIIGRLD